MWGFCPVDYDCDMYRSLSPEEQFRVIARIWDSSEDGWVFLPWIDGKATDKRDRKSKWHEDSAFEWPVDRDKVLSHIQDRQNDDLFFSVSKFLQPQRVKEHVGEISCLYADLDEVNPITDIDSNMQPSIAWETSPGRFQGVWIMEGMRWDETQAGMLNHRLTNALGADDSGWDVTQVLRVPGKMNHKFDYKQINNGKPVLGKFMWFRSKIYKWSFLEDSLPDVRVAKLAGAFDETEFTSIDRHEVWSRVRLKCSSVVREYMSMKRRDAENHDDRSGVLWQIERDLADAGCSIAEIVAVVRATGWNKHAPRNNELQQLINEASKAIGVKEEDDEDIPLESNSNDSNLPRQLLTLADLGASNIPRPNWLIKDIWTRGSCGFISGMPKSYKSYFALDMALSVSTGKPFLNDSQFTTGKPRKVIYLQEEDSLPLIMRRAEEILDSKSPDRHWHGQLDVSDGVLLDDVTGRQGLIWTPSTPLDGLAMIVRAGFIASDQVCQSWLAAMVVEFDAELVIIDTLGTTIGDIDSDKSTALNDRVLRPLKVIAETAGCAIAIVHHNKKADDNGRSGQQMLGSVALHAWVESALYVKSKEKLTHQSAEVKVERENKLASDLKFRVRIPDMNAEHGDDQAGHRALWNPEILTGWGDTEMTKPDREQAPSKAGDKIVRVMREMGAGPIPTQRIADVYGQSLGNTKNQLNAAFSRGLINGSHDGGWTVV